MARGTQLGWNVPGDLADRVRSVAESQGTRPGKVCAAALELYLQQIDQPIDSRLVEARMLRALGLTPEGVDRLQHLEL
jgi:hypothetical protein